MAFFRILLVLSLGCVAPEAGAEPVRPQARALEAAVVSQERVVSEVRPRLRPDTLAPVREWCTESGRLCISRANYIPDVCSALQVLSRKNGLNPHFLARLIWKESLFDRTAVSHAGAEGIAQFIPQTASRRGLADAFNPAMALAASAAYLSELSADFGNIGLAAAAYNAGEGRAAGFVEGQRTLPRETRAYVFAITGYSGLAWRDHPPPLPTLDLDPDMSFREACTTLAGRRIMREFGPQNRPSAEQMLLALGVWLEAGYEANRARRVNILGPEEALFRRTDRIDLAVAEDQVIRLGQFDGKDVSRICTLMPGCRVLPNWRSQP